jgi:acetyltransferase-like isoleucine patch superfamily enzyme
VHIGDDNRIRCHEGSLRIGDKTVFGRDNTINCYLDISIEPESLISDWVYICDFDHRSDDIDTAIRRQGIIKAPVRIGRGSWIGVKASVLRGADVGEHSIVGAHSVVRGVVPPYSVVAGIPSRVVRVRRPVPPAPEIEVIDAATRQAVEARVTRAQRAVEEGA